MATGQGTAAAALGDLITTTRRHLPKKTLNNTFKYQSYEVLGYLMAKGRYEVGSGRGIQETVRIDEMGTAAHVDAYEERELNQKDVVQPMIVDFVNADAYWVISDIETGQNRPGPDEIVSIIVGKRSATFESIANIMEEAFFGTPSATNLKLPWGLKYWIVQRGSAGEGFDGGAATGFTTVGAINPTTYARWKNYTAGGTAYYEDINRTAITTIRKARMKTNFKAPARVDLGLSPQQKLRLYVNDVTFCKVSERAEDQNDNLGFDVMAAQGRTLIGRIPMQYIPALDADTSYPLYGVDMSTFKLRLMRGRVLREADPMFRAKQPDVAINWILLSYLFWCNNRRRNWVVAQ